MTRLATLSSVASPRLRFALASIAFLSAASKLLAVVIAMKIAEGDLRGATIVGLVVGGIFAVARVVASGARVNAECDLNLAVTKALLESDVLVEPTSQPLRNLPEPLFYARSLLTDVVPELVASAVAAVVVAPLLASRLSARAVAVSGLAVVVVMTVLLVLNRVSSALQRRVMKAQQDVIDSVGFAVEGRLELVARGAEDATMRSLEQLTFEYRSVARRGGWSAALIGRAPLAAGLGAVLVVVLLDASSREAVTAAVLAQALVLAACIPILLGVVLRANDLTRIATMIGPVTEVLCAPPRVELARGAKAAPPSLPATITAEDVTFAYDAAGTPTLRQLRFEWRPGTALVVEGPNGSGKSTLMRLVLGLRSPQQGSMRVGGADLTTLDLRALRQGMAYLPQRPYLGEPGVTIGASLRSVDESLTDEVMRSVLARVGLAPSLASRGPLLAVPVGELSAGQRQRLGLARILVRDAGVYLLDEPDANLDREGIVMVGEVVAELLSRGRMVAIAAHTPELSAIEGVRVALSSP